MAIRNYGWVPQVKDHNDWQLADRLQLPTTRVARGSNRAQTPWVKNQQSIGSCTGFGTTRVIRAALRKAGLPDADISALMSYFIGRVLMGTTASDSGVSIRDSLKAAATWGVCLEVLWPYITSLYTQKPPQAAYDDAINRQILDYYAVNNDPDSINAALSAGFQITLGLPVCMSFETAPQGAVPMPQAGENVLGGHNIVLDSWDDSVTRYGFATPWSEAYGGAPLGSFPGVAGFGTIPYDFITNLAADLWVVRAAESSVTPTPTPPPPASWYNRIPTAQELDDLFIKVHGPVDKMPVIFADGYTWPTTIARPKASMSMVVNGSNYLADDDDRPSWMLN